MTEKRDLKADLELCDETKDLLSSFKQHDYAKLFFAEEALRGWPHAIEQALVEKERANKAEALVRELAEALKKAHEHIGDINSFSGQGLQVHGWHLNGLPEPLDNLLVAVTKIKEALGGDQNTPLD